MRAPRWLAVPVAAFVLVTACSDDGDDRSDPARSSRPPTSTTIQPSGTTTPPENAACALVTRGDAEAVFGEPARPGAPEDPGGDAVCVWEAGDDGGGPYQFLEFRLHEGSSLITSNTSSAPVNITVQKAQGGRVYAFTYLSDVGDAGAKQAAVDDLADSVIARAE